MRTFLYILGIVFFLVVLAMAVNWPSDADMAQHRGQQAVDDACRKMLEDAAPGAEKRTTRALCDEARHSTK